MKCSYRNIFITIVYVQLDKYTDLYDAEETTYQGRQEQRQIIGCRNATEGWSAQEFEPVSVNRIVEAQERLHGGRARVLQTAQEARNAAARCRRAGVVPPGWAPLPDANQQCTAEGDGAGDERRLTMGGRSLSCSRRTPSKSARS